MNNAHAGSVARQAEGDGSRLWRTSVGAVGVLLAALVVVDGLVLFLLVAPRQDPHGYSLIVSVLAFALLLPPTITAVAAMVNLLRRRRRGYLDALAAYGWVALWSTLILGLNASSPGSNGISVWEVVVPALIALYGVAGSVVAVKGWRNEARPRP